LLILKLLAGGKTGAYPTYVRILHPRQMSHATTSSLTKRHKKGLRKSYFEAARRGQNRSIPYVCEDFAPKADVPCHNIKPYKTTQKKA